MSANTTQVSRQLWHGYPVAQLTYDGAFRGCERDEDVGFYVSASWSKNCEVRDRMLKYLGQVLHPAKYSREDIKAELTCQGLSWHSWHSFLYSHLVTCWGSSTSPPSKILALRPALTRWRKDDKTQAKTCDASAANHRELRVAEPETR